MWNLGCRGWVPAGKEGTKRQAGLAQLKGILSCL